MICEKAQVKGNCDSIYKNEFLLDTNIRYNYETKLKKFKKNVAYISSTNMFLVKINSIKNHELIP